MVLPPPRGWGEQHSGKQMPNGASGLPESAAQRSFWQGERRLGECKEKRRLAPWYRPGFALRAQPDAGRCWLWVYLLTFLCACPSFNKSSPKQSSRNHSVPLEGKGHGMEGSFSELYHFLHHGVWLPCCMLSSSLRACSTVGGLLPAGVCARCHVLGATL